MVVKTHMNQTDTLPYDPAIKLIADQKVTSI
jgi:hypothetical protein